MSGIITGPVFLKDMGNPSSTVTGTIVSIFQVGAFFGAIFTFLKGETMGRRKTLIYGSAADIVGAILQCSAYGQAQMFVGRIISGLGMLQSTLTTFHDVSLTFMQVSGCSLLLYLYTSPRSCCQALAVLWEQLY